MKNLVFSILLISGISYMSAQIDNKNKTPSAFRNSLQDTMKGRLPDTSTRNTLIIEKSTFQNNLNPTPPNRDNNRNSNFSHSNAWHQMGLQEQKETVKKMSPTERTQLMQSIKENLAIEELNIPEEVQQEFKSLFSEYMSKHKNIKEKFRTINKIEKMSPEEALGKLNESFTIGQQLLDNRKNYAEKFLKILTPQQVLKLYQMEGKFRDKMLDKKYD